MKPRLSPWVMLLLLAGVCTGIVAGVAVYRARFTSPAALVRRLPADGAVILSIDFAALRKAGVLSILGGQKVTQEVEYRAFVDQTGFDYATDLNQALISFHRTGTYFVLEGRFDWKALQDYVRRESGNCHNSFCRVSGSVPERKISFFPLRNDVMALAVSKNDYAAIQLQSPNNPRNMETPQDPVWSLIPVAELKKSTSLPPAAEAFLAALGGAQNVLLSAAPEDRRVTVRLDAACRSPRDAAALANQLRDITAHLRDAVVTPSPKDLSGVLAAGVFEQKESHVLGRWPVERELLESLAGSSM